KAGIKIVKGLIESVELIREYGPVCVVGFGGYPSFPTVKAAQWLKITTILHEQNAVFGRANRRLSKLAKRIAVSFKETKSIPLEDKKKVSVTGNPIRKLFLDAATPFQAPAPGQNVHILAFAGSQGSTLFSDVLPEAIRNLPEALRKHITICQQARAEDVARVSQVYGELGVKAKVQPFFIDMLEQYKRAHLVISRAGASTITEIMVMGRPALFVPLAASLDGDQAQNAHQLVSHQAGWMLEEKNFTADELATKLKEILGNPAALEKAATAALSFSRPRATSVLADLIMKRLEKE
ncbi:MAG: UDP-N-acetylglucosamine--N-acetylmuramyl-(pentapeptide) pyrophosphoryl-undecaprenol, partial [Alphaproteobacteria bacterium]|nr:UDP-N-acetylglucosamine--N-acetylmuramyl-(pentapeptide) pyrophosphoryl-undecaprenol [Alphaproteobacteria bacterium]